MATHERKLFWFALLGVMCFGCIWYLSHSRVETQDLDANARHRQVDRNTTNTAIATDPTNADYRTKIDFTAMSSAKPNIDASTQRVIGQILDPALQAIGSASLKIHTADTNYSQIPFFSDPDGFFSIPVPSFLPFIAEVSAPGFQTERVSLPLDSIEESNTIILKPGGVLEVLVRNESLRPIENARISTNTEAFTSTDAAGTAQLRGLANPAYLWISAPGYNDQRRTVSQKESSLEIILKADAILRGRVVHQESGKPVTRFRIQLNFALGKSLVHELYSEDGYFELPNLNREVQRISVISKNLLPAFQAMSNGLLAGKSPIYAFHLSSQGIFFSGKVVNSKGEGLSGAEVNAYVGDLASQPPPRKLLLNQGESGPQDVGTDDWLVASTENTGTDGAFKMGPLPIECSILLTAHHPDHASTLLTQAEMLLEEDRNQLVLILEDYASVNGTAGQSDQPVPRKIALTDGLQFLQEIILLPEEQSFSFTKVHGGPIRVTLQAAEGDHQSTGGVPGVVPDETSFQLEPGASREIALGHEPKLRLAGHIFLDQIPMANSLVIIIREKPPKRIYKTQTNADGYFTLYPLGKGTYQIMANGTRDDEIFGARNRKTITLSQDSLDLHFDFGSMGNVLGRVPVSWESQALTLEIDYPIAHQTQARSLRNTHVQQGGFFQFVRVPAGIFRIAVEPKHQPQVYLVTDEIMPDDGSDLDLGDLGDSASQISVSLLAPPEFHREKVSLHLTETLRGATSRYLAAQFSSETSPVLLQGLSPGPYLLEASVLNLGFQVEPQKLPIEILESIDTEAQFELIPVTAILVRNGETDSEDGFVRANLFQEATQRNWPVPFGEDLSPQLFRSQEAQMILQKGSLFAQSLPEGWWQLHLENYTGLIVSRRFQLMKGKPILFQVDKTHFQSISSQR